MNQSLFTGEQLSLEGQQISVNHANAVHDGWGEKAYKLLTEYISCYGSTPFIAESFRQYAELMGLPSSIKGQAYGSVFTRAKKAGLIKIAGYTTASNPLAHKRPCYLWVKAY